MELKQIGTIKVNNYKYKAKIDEKYAKALEGLDGFSHCIVLWWADKCDNTEARNILDCDRPYKKSPEKLGIFSTRSPARPNPIASTVVQILSIEKLWRQCCLPLPVNLRLGESCIFHSFSERTRLVINFEYLQEVISSMYSKKGEQMKIFAVSESDIKIF